jgi:hypothetical protein
MRSEAILADRIQSEIAQRQILCVDRLSRQPFSGRFWSCRATRLFCLVAHAGIALRSFHLRSCDPRFRYARNERQRYRRLPRSRHECDNPTRQHESLPWVRKSNMLKPPMTASLLRPSGSHIDAQMKTMGQIYQSFQQQAGILSYIDVLQPLAIFCDFMVPLMSLMKRPPKGTTVAAH